MASNDIKFKVIATADGFDIVQKKQKGLADQIDKTNKSTKQLDKTQEKNYGRQKQGLIQTANGTKNFSKLSQTIGSGSSGLVGAYATLAANVFAASAAFNALRQAAAFEQLTEGFTFMANESGRTTSLVVDRLKEITGQALSTREALESASLALSAGFKTEELETLAKVARGASLALGRNLNDAFDRLTRGAIKLEPEILDELGIMVRLDDAVEKYAATLGKSAKSLTQFERQQAFLNAINEQGIEKYGAIADAIDVNPYDRLSAAFEDLTKTGFGVINKVLIPLVELFAGSSGAMIGGLVLFGSTIVTQMIPALGQMAQRAKQAADDNLELANSLKESTDATVLAGREGIKSAKGGSKQFKEYRLAVKAGTATQAEHTHQSMLSDKRLNRARVARATLEKTENIKDKARHEQKMRDLDARIAKEIQLGQAIRSQIGVPNVGAGLLTAEAESNIASQRSIGLTAIGAAGGPIAGFKEARFQMKEFRKSADFTNARTKLMGINFGKAAAGIRLAGTAMSFYGSALLNAIPFIGQAIFFGSLLFGVFKKMRTTTEDLNPALKSLAEITDTIGDKFEQLNKKMAGIDQVLGEIAQFKTTAGIVGEINAELARSVAITDQLIKKERKLADDRKKNLSPFSQFSTTGMQTVETEGTIEAAFETRVKKLQQAQSKAARDTLEEVFKDTSPASQLLQQSLIETAKSMDLVINSSGKTSASTEKIIEIFKKTAEPIVATNDNLQSLKKQLTSVEKEFAKFFESSSAKTKFDKVRDNFVSLDETITALTEAGETDKVNKLLEETGNQIERFAGVTESGAKGIAQLRKIFETLSKKTVTVKNEIKSLNLQIKSLDQISKNSGVATGVALELTNQRTEKTKELLQLELDTLDTESEDEIVIAKIRELKQAIVVETQKILTNEEITSKSRAASLRLEQKMATILKEQGKLTNDLAVANEKLAKFRRGEGTELNILERIRAEKKAQKDEIAHVEKVGNLKNQLDRENLISKLLEQQKQLDAVEDEATKKRLETAYVAAGNAERKIIEANEDKLITQIQLMKALLQLTPAEEFTKAFQSGNLLDTALAFTELDQGQQTAANSAKIAVVAFNQMGDAIGKLNDGFGQAIGHLTTMAMQIMTLSDTVSQLKDLFSGEDANIGKLLGLDAQQTAMAVAGAMAISSAISAFGAAQQGFAQSRVKEIDNMIASEKRMDGKSKESVAKVKELEAKKLAIQKKAFEQNKKIQIANAIIATSVAAAITYAALAKAFPLNIAAAAAIVALGMAQVNMIKKTTFQGGASESSAPASSLNIGGQRNNRVDVSQSATMGEASYLRGGQGVGSNANTFTPGGAMGRKGYADGGMLVGERGPEIVTKEEIIPNYALGGEKNMNLTFNVNAVDAQSVQELLTNNQGAVVGAIRDAANSYGQDFLPDVNVGYGGDG